MEERPLSYFIHLLHQSYCILWQSQVMLVLERLEAAENTISITVLLTVVEPQVIIVSR